MDFEARLDRQLLLDELSYELDDTQIVLEARKGEQNTAAGAIRILNRALTELEYANTKSRMNKWQDSFGDLVRDIASDGRKFELPRDNDPKAAGGQLRDKLSQYVTEMRDNPNVKVATPDLNLLTKAPKIATPDPDLKLAAEFARIKKESQKPGALGGPIDPEAKLAKEKESPSTRSPGPGPEERPEPKEGQKSGRRPDTPNDVAEAMEDDETDQDPGAEDAPPPGPEEVVEPETAPSGEDNPDSPDYKPPEERAEVTGGPSPVPPPAPPAAPTAPAGAVPVPAPAPAPPAAPAAAPTPAAPAAAPTPAAPPVPPPASPATANLAQPAPASPLAHVRQPVSGTLGPNMPSPVLDPLAATQANIPMSDPRATQDITNVNPDTGQPWTQNDIETAGAATQVIPPELVRDLRAQKDIPTLRVPVGNMVTQKLPPPAPKAGAASVPQAPAPAAKAAQKQPEPQASISSPAAAVGGLGTVPDIIKALHSKFTVGTPAGAGTTWNDKLAFAASQRGDAASAKAFKVADPAKLEQLVERVITARKQKDPYYFIRKIAEYISKDPNLAQAMSKAVNTTIGEGIGGFLGRIYGKAKGWAGQQAKDFRTAVTAAQPPAAQPGAQLSATATADPYDDIYKFLMRVMSDQARKEIFYNAMVTVVANEIANSANAEEVKSLLGVQTKSSKPRSPKAKPQPAPAQPAPPAPVAPAQPVSAQPATKDMPELSSVMDSRQHVGFMIPETVQHLERKYTKLDPTKLTLPGYTNIDRQLFAERYNYYQDLLTRARGGDVTLAELEDVHQIKRIRHDYGDVGVLKFVAEQVGGPDDCGDTANLGDPEGYFYENRFIRSSKPMIDFNIDKNRDFNKTLDKALSEDWSHKATSELTRETALDVLLIVKQHLKNVGCYLMTMPTVKFNLNGFDMFNLDIKCKTPEKVINRLQQTLPEVRYDFDNNPAVYSYLAVNAGIGREVRDRLGLDIVHYDRDGKPAVSVTKPPVRRPAPSPPVGTGIPGSSDEFGAPAAPPVPGALPGAELAATPEMQQGAPTPELAPELGEEPVQEAEPTPGLPPPAGQPPRQFRETTEEDLELLL